MARAGLTIGRKLVAIVAGTATLGIVATAGIAYIKTSEQLASEARHHLAGLRDGRVAALTDYLRGIRTDIETQARSPGVRNALRDFETAWGSWTAIRASGFKTSTSTRIRIRRAKKTS